MTRTSKQDVWEDVAETSRVVEGFVVESWIEHQRQHARVTNTDALDQELLNAYHNGGQPPISYATCCDRCETV